MNVVEAAQQLHQNRQRAASDLVALSTGVRLPEAEQQFALWGRAVERCAYEGVARATKTRRSHSDSTQHLRYMLIQSLHRTVVRSLLQQPAPPHSHHHLWRLRGTAMASAPMPLLPKATLELLHKHSSGGLTGTYKKHAFGEKKSNLKKIRKTLAAAIPPPEQPLPPSTLEMPPELHQQLMALLGKTRRA